ncbi:AraC family transcriptional regulator [Chitinophaga pendula]|uniref:helix-turn-helix domain-containing protein n=1 Tax=Chitinophaga TaxID=79328 RepID=UPI000BAF89FC|nr:MULTISPECIES: AraC family transcriptional regulator [Chitinophaga]ASZ14243.1 AraC family transcriptional regulator [Chitinophaga sp. MD30]UCJ08113.1 AraC family transcriptional regulator [Chitinophaga pendula]
MKVLAFKIPVAQQASVIVQEDRMPYFYDHLHQHPEIQVSLILKGEGTLIAGNYMGAFAPGDIYWIGAGQPHIFKSDPAYFAAGSTLYIHALTFFFHPTQTAAELLQLPEMQLIREMVRQSANGFRITPPHTVQLEQQFRELFRQEGVRRLMAFLDLLDTIHQQCQRTALSQEKNDWNFSEAEGVRMNEIYQHSIRHFRKPISLDEIAGIAHMTVPAFCRYFKKRTRKTYIRFLNELRISHACKLLKSDKELPFAMIAFESGFSNVTSFNRTFKDITGYAPGIYQKKYKAG